jgi:SAM-dependent methyltransferase
MSADTDASPARCALARHLLGDGIEIGPCRKPMPISTGANVRYLDRWPAPRSQELHPELDGFLLVGPDLPVDVDADGLPPLSDASVDFVIASHVLEHLANPIGLLDEMHRVLREGGVILIVLPDRTRPVDAGRPPTALADVIGDYRRQARRVDESHLLDFPTGADPSAMFLERPSEAERERLFAWHRDRSVQVHCWSQFEFWPVVGFGIEALGHQWEHVDGFATDNPASDGLEFGFVARKGFPRRTTEVRLHRWYADVAAWDAAQPHGLAADLAAARAEAAAVRHSNSWRITAPLRLGADSVRRVKARLGTRH